MIEVVIAVAFVGVAVVFALHDSFRRALNVQVRSAELRVEALKRADYEAVTKAVAELRAEVKKVASDLASLDQALAVGRRR